jgi:hypothetical protein
MRFFAWLWVTAVLCALPAMLRAAEPQDSLPEVPVAALPECLNAGQALAQAAADRRQGMAEATAIAQFYERNRDVHRLGSHVPTPISRDKAAALVKLVYAYPQLPPDSFSAVGVYHCEIARHLPPDHPHAGDVLPLLAINAHDCLQRWGDPVADAHPKDGILKLDNAKTDACEGRAARAILRELLK